VGRLDDISLYIRKREDTQGKWWMPRLGEAKKDVLDCEKPRGAVKEH